MATLTPSSGSVNLVKHRPRKTMLSKGHVITAARKVTRRANARGACKTSPTVSLRTSGKVTRTLRLLLQSRIKAGKAGEIQNGSIDLRTRSPKVTRMWRLTMSRLKSLITTKKKHIPFNAMSVTKGMITTPPHVPMAMTKSRWTTSSLRNTRSRTPRRLHVIHPNAWELPWWWWSWRAAREADPAACKKSRIEVIILRSHGSMDPNTRWR